MVKTPTFHVFHMYRHHQGAELLNSTLSGSGEVGPEEWRVPNITESVSRDGDGVITITLNNLSATAAEKVEIAFADHGKKYEVVEANIVTDKQMQAHNTFEDPDHVTEQAFTGYEVTADGITVTLPACSVTEIRVK